MPTVESYIIENERVEIPVDKCKKLQEKDEYDTDNVIVEYITLDNPVTIRGEIPGTGKSYICQRMIDRDLMLYLFALLKKRLQSCEGEGITRNKFFGI